MRSTAPRGLPILVTGLAGAAGIAILIALWELTGAGPDLDAGYAGITAVAAAGAGTAAWLGGHAASFDRAILRGSCTAALVLTLAVAALLGLWVDSIDFSVLD